MKAVKKDLFYSTEKEFWSILKNLVYQSVSDVLTSREDLLVAELLFLEEVLQESLVAAAHFGLHRNRQGDWTQKLGGQTLNDRWYTTTLNMLLLKS